MLRMVGLPTVKLPKSNWANTLDEGPFEAYQITCGITFTFGGVKSTQMLRSEYRLPANRGPIRCR